jgi:hypothetical protein
MTKVRFYKYYFRGNEKPIIMEAESRLQADQMMQELKERSKVPISVKDLIDVRVETPIIGISIRKKKGNEFVWVSKEHTPDGWLLKSEYDKIQELKNQNDASHI